MLADILYRPGNILIQASEQNGIPLPLAAPAWGRQGRAISYFQNTHHLRSSSGPLSLQILQSQGLWCFDIPRSLVK